MTGDVFDLFQQAPRRVLRSTSNITVPADRYAMFYRPALYGFTTELQPEFAEPSETIAANPSSPIIYFEFDE